MNEASPFAPVASRRGRIAAITLGLLALAGAGLVFTRPPSAAPAPAQPRAALTVTIASATSAEWPLTLAASGAIAPWQEAVIGAQVAGLRLAEIRANVGDVVKRGQVLAVFDAELLRADEARLAAAWQQAEANRQRALQIKGSGAMSEQELLQYETQAEVARAQLQTTRLQLSYATVKAPDDGVISARSATLGAVSGSGAELFRMIRQNRLEWRGEFTAAQFARIKPGQRVDLALPDGSRAAARVRQLAPALDAHTRLGIAYADLEPKSTARAGMYAQGAVALSSSPALTVPAAGVVVRDGRSYVPKLVDGGRISLQPVEVGRRHGEAAEILSGIAAGERVAVRGAGFLNDGDLVRVAPDMPEAPKAGRE
ncbi:MAG: efflux RND transporter periplasmic adaptor subunit [Rhodocyclaceae bacterium]|nr:efflux RND transporter periplasmic adaptor subunit [Rhodocyclaceae bacterium]